MIRQVALSCLIGAVLCVATTAASAEAVRITNGEWPPFTSEHLPHNGPLSRIVREAFALEGVQVEYGYFPWKRAYEYARGGKWDGSIGWAPSAKHQQDFYLSNPVIRVRKALYYLKSTPFDWLSIDDLGKWRLGATAGYSYGSEWDQAATLGRIHVDEVVTDEQSIRKLLLGRVDVVAMEVDVANYLMSTQLSASDAALIRVHRKTLVETPICLVLPRQVERSSELLARFNRGLQRLKESGRLEGYLRAIRTKAPH